MDAGMRILEEIANELKTLMILATTLPPNRRYELLKRSSDFTVHMFGLIEAGLISSGYLQDLVEIQEKLLALAKEREAVTSPASAQLQQLFKRLGEPSLH